MSKVFKSSRVILDDKAFVLSTKIEKATDHKKTELKEQLAAHVDINHPLQADELSEERAENQGYEEGYEAAMRDSSETSKAIVDEALALKNEWLKAKEVLMKASEKEMVEIVLESIEKILNKKVEEDAHLIEALIQEAVKRVNKTENLTLRVSSEDYSHVLSIKPMIVAMTEKVDDIEIKQDSSLKNGSCIIDTDSGSIDSSVWTQFEQIRKMFEDLLKSE